MSGTPAKLQPRDYAALSDVTSVATILGLRVIGHRDIPEDEIHVLQGDAVQIVKIQNQPPT